MIVAVVIVAAAAATVILHVLIDNQSAIHIYVSILSDSF
jgi:hypothetical protein